MRIHHLALRTADVARLEAFYTGALGLAALPSAGAPGAAGARGGSVWLAAGEAVLMLERAADGEPGVPPGTMELLAFTVDGFHANSVGASPAGADGDVAGDLKEAWRARLEGAGVRIEGETAHTLYFRDPDGRRVAFSVHPLC